MYVRNRFCFLVLEQLVYAIKVIYSGIDWVSLYLIDISNKLLILTSFNEFYKNTSNLIDLILYSSLHVSLKHNICFNKSNQLTWVGSHT